MYIGIADGRYYIDRTVYDFCRRTQRIQIESRISGLLADCRLDSQTTSDQFIRREAEPISRVAPEFRGERPLYHNIEFCMNGALAQLGAVEEFSISPATMLHKFSELRDMFSLFPRNDAVRKLVDGILRIQSAKSWETLDRDIGDRTLILHVSCVKYLSRAQASIASFPPSERFVHLIVIGNDSSVPGEATLSFDYSDGLLEVPVPDDYEHLHQKIFHALFVLSTTCADVVVKIDDSLHCADWKTFGETLDRFRLEGHAAAGRVVGSLTHPGQWHGWHIGKCRNPGIEARGYQFPLPREYPAGGYGYILSRRSVDACAYMYLAMKAFFEISAVGLEDAYVGHALYAANLTPHSLFSEEHLRALPGLRSTEG